MWNNVLKLIIGVSLSLLVIGCGSSSSQHNPDSEELKPVTAEQEAKLAGLAERVEKKEAVKMPFKNDKGEVIGTITSETTVYLLKQSAGGGRFSVNSTCTSTCAGTPIDIDPGGDSKKNSCGCNDKCDACTGPYNSNGCTGSCTKSRIGSGNFGIFIAKYSDPVNPLNSDVASK